MKTTIISALLLVLAFSTAAIGKRHIRYEGTFDNWTISNRGKASVKENCGIDGKRSCFVLEGTSDTNPYVSSLPIPMSGSEVLFNAVFKCTEGSKIYLGINSAQYDISIYVYVNNTELSDGWKETSSLLRIPDRSSRKAFVGMYYKEGTCYIDRVDITEVEVVPVSEDPKYGILAPDDTIKKDGTFESIIFGDDFYGTINPHIKSISATWNSNRAGFDDGRNITFDYSGLGSMLKKPLTVDFQVHYVSNSNAFLTLMESSDNGKTWTDVGTFGKKVDTFKFTLSSVAHNMFCVIMKNSAGSVQISKATVTSEVRDKPADAVRGKQVVHVPVGENEVTVNIAEKYDTKGNFITKLTNTGNSSIESFIYDFSTVTTSGLTLTVDKTSGSINKGESTSITSEIKFSSSDDNVINYGVHDNNGIEYASGRFIVSKTHFFDEDRYGNYITEDSGCGTMWWCGSTFKVSKDRIAPAQSTKKDVIDLYAAKNEFEAFQFILKASSSDQVISDVSMSTLTSVDNSSVVITNVSVRRVMYVKTEYATDTIYGRAGEYWPDPIVPLDLPYTCPANENCPFWVLVYVPFDAKEGSYKGTASLTAGGKKLSADVSLKVWNFTISKKQRLKSLFGFNTGRVNIYHHITDNNRTAKKIIYEKYFESFSRHRINPYRSYPLDGYSSKYEGGELKLRYENFVKRIKETHSEDGYGFSAEIITLEGLFSNIGEYEWGSAEHTRLFDKHNTLFQEVLRNYSILDEMYVRWIDEPEESEYDHVIEGNEAIKRGGPDIKVLLTEQVEDRLKGHVNVWCPVFANYVKEDTVPRQALGEEAWTYICCCPKGKRITLFIDHPADELRLWIWHAFKNNIDGLLLWDTTYWSRNTTYLQDPYTETMSWDSNDHGNQWGNGDGRFFYPPVNWKENTDEYILDDPVESVRWEILRDGMEDWEYFTTLKEISTSKDITKEQKEIANKLLDIPDSIVGDIDTMYSVTPDDMLARRDEVGKFINAYFCDEKVNGSSLVGPVCFWVMIIAFIVTFCF